MEVWSDSYLILGISTVYPFDSYASILILKLCTWFHFRRRRKEKSFEEPRTVMKLSRKYYHNLWKEGCLTSQNFNGEVPKNATLSMKRIIFINCPLLRWKNLANQKSLVPHLQNGPTWFFIPFWNGVLYLQQTRH